MNAARIYASGLRATEEPEGIRLQEAVVHIARRGGVRVIGSNCMGMHSPESGDMAVVSQSGGFHRVNRVVPYQQLFGETDALRA